MAANRDDILLQRLQDTIDTWNSEVTSAHEGLAKQIGEARQQLGVLIETLNRRAKSVNGRGETLRSQALEQRDAALRDVMERNRVLDETIGQLQEERRTFHAQLEVALAEAEELRGQVRAYQEQETQSARHIERLERELNALRESAGAAAAARIAADEELGRLREAIEEASRSQAAAEAERDTMAAELEARTKVAEKSTLEVESLTRALRRLEETLTDQNRQYEDRITEITAELSTAERMLSDQQEQIAGLTDDRARLSEQLATAQTEMEAATARAEAQESAGREALRELESVRRLAQQRQQAEAKLREQLDAARAQAEEAAARAEAQEASGREALAELEAVRGLQREQEQRESALRRELEAARAEAQSATARADEQESATRDALREMEAVLAIQQDHQQLEAALREELNAARAEVEELRRADRELRDEIGQLNHQFERQSARLAESVRELEAHWGLANESNDRDEAQRREIDAIREELEQARAESAQLARQLEEARSADRDTAEQIESRLAALARENEELKRLVAETESKSPVSAADDSAERAELEAVRQELLAFEQLLIEREEAVEIAAQRMQQLEETAYRVQSEVAALRSSQRGGAQDELEQLRARVSQLENANAEQAARIVEQEAELADRRSENAELMRHLETETGIAEPAVQPELRPAFAFDAHDAEGQKKSMGEILVEAGIITSKQLDGALDEQRSAKKRRLGSILVEKGLIREEIVAQVVASQLKLPFVRLSETKIERGAVALLDGRLATHHMCFPISATTAEVVVAMANPLDVIAIEDLEFATHLKIRPVVATLSDITSAIVEHYGVTIANAIAEDTFDLQTPPRVPTRQQKLD